jgi:archaemetzincin
MLEEIKKINSEVVLRNNIDFPANSYVKARNRYRADSIIKFLSQKVGKDTVILGLTYRDISTTKGSVQDWGVMGLGYMPGNACVASSFRLSEKNKNEQFYKVALHELGHTQGLPHCKDTTCIMRDAQGGNPIDQETGFCPSCKKHLQERGWKLQ